jgi:UDP-glucose-4-epimerase GalE
MRVLVTGGAGYIGSQTCKTLRKMGFEPVVFDNLIGGHSWAVQWGPFVEGDLANKNALAAAMSRYDVEAVVHFAAHAYVGESMRNPQKYFRNNVANSLNVLDAMLDSGVKQIVFSSTCATYGIPEILPISELHQQHPVSPYGESKLFVERALHWYAQAYGLSWVALRYFNAAGADLEGETGETHNPETHLIPLAIEAAIAQDCALSIYGCDYQTADGTAVRDYVHVTDLADAHVKALEYLRRGGMSRAFNLGSGRGYSVKEVVMRVEEIGGTRLRTRECARRIGDPPILVAEPADAQIQLNWSPRYSDLETIVSTAWNWRTLGMPAKLILPLHEDCSSQ